MLAVNTTIKSVFAVFPKGKKFISVKNPAYVPDCTNKNGFEYVHNFFQNVSFSPPASALKNII